ncbi:MAG: DUF5020 family protein [Bacteroidales bacterium]
MRPILIIIAIMASQGLLAQNLQLHCIFGEKKVHPATRVEMFQADQWGSTYFFIDMFYGISDELNGMNMAYWEISRGLKFWDSPFEIHLEYNGGLGRFELSEATGAYTINDAWLLGGHYTFANESFSKTFTIQAMYKYIKYKQDLSFQLTGIWDLNFFKEKLTFEGYADYWKEQKTHQQGTTEYIFMTEAQLWYNFTEQLAAGGRFELTNNFSVKGMAFTPGLGARWIF